MAQRDERGRFIPGSGGGGSGGGGSSGGGGGGGGDAAKGASAAAGAFTKALGASNKLAGGIKALGSATKVLSKGELPSASQAMNALGSAAGGLVSDGANKLADALGQLGPVGEAAGAAVRAVGAALSATIGVLAQWAGMAIEAAQKADLLRDRFAALAGSASAGKAVQDALGKVSAALPAELAARVNDWGRSLLAAGMQGKQLEEAVKGIAAATALMGDSGGAAAEKLIKQLAEGGAGADKLVKSLQQGGGKTNKLLADMGLSTKDLAAALGVSEAEFAKMKLSAGQLNDAIAKSLQKKGKGPLEDMALTLPNILAKARAGFMSLFAGLSKPVKALMKEVKSLFGEFNKGGALWKALKPVMTSVLTTVFTWLKAGVKATHELIQGFMGTKGAKGPFAEIGASIKQVWNAVKGLVKSLGLLDSSKPSKLPSGLSVLVAIIKGVADMITVLIGQAQLAIAIFDSLSGITGAVTGALSGLADSAMSAASSFIDGIVSGITSGAGAVFDAVANLASGALAKFKSILGIASPSKVMAKMGGFAAEGAAQGLDQGAGKVQDSAAALGEGVKGGAAKGMGKAGGGKGKGGITINGGVTINATGTTSGAIAEEAFAALMERLAASQGAT